jgi:hypothetical protein
VFEDLKTSCPGQEAICLNPNYYYLGTIHWINGSNYITKRLIGEKTLLMAVDL